ncbi:MAG: glycosyltransferase family 4 protein [Selenomonadaceae bacterium]|nr:glycosyltransferase family 4 protein [Selenomonadaceae bacterium]MBQ9496513.1 glycosyltransferase family 4 protein [Selenomonadaceae bacterium]
MNICLLIKDFAVGKKFLADGRPTKSGAEIHGENHALQLIRLGHRVTLMTKKRFFHTAARENFNGIDLVRLHPPFRWLEIFLRLLTTHNDIDAFYIIGTPKFSVWAILFAKIFNKPVTLALTGKAEIFSAGKNWRNKIFAKCTRYVATTKEIRDGFVKSGGISPEKISILPHGIDTKKFPQSNENRRRELKISHDIEPERKILLFCARVVKDKGVDTLQDVWKILHAKFPDALLYVVGGGLNHLLDELRTLSAALDDSIKVIGEVDAPQEFYQLADVYIFPSRHEGLPTSLLEAMASGLPSVTSDIGGCEDVIADDVNGYRVYSEDAAAFAEKISLLFEDDARRKIFGERAAQLIRETCDFTTVIPKLAEIIAAQ